MKKITAAKATLDCIKYLTIIEADGKTITADEPLDRGGGGEGLNPGQLLLAGLGACTAITLRMYADRKQWKVGGIEIELILYSLEDKSSRIETSIRFKGTPPVEQKARLLQIAELCPIHKLLTGKVEIITTEYDHTL